MTQRMKRDRRNLVLLSLLMFPPLFIASAFSRMRGGKAGTSIVRDAAAEARSAIEIAFTDA
jgi:hypothetical protein